MSDEIRTAVDLRTSIVDQRGGIERFDGPQRRLLDALVFELAKKPNEIDVRVVTDLMAMLPRPVSAPEPDNARDPRQVMWEIYKQMRERGEIGVKPLAPPEHRINELEAEIERLRAALGAGSTALTPAAADIVPPGEIGECYAGIRPAPDDPPQRSTRVIEGNAAAVTPAASAAPPAKRPPTWDDTPNGKAWQAWHDAGGRGGSDPWANNNR
jgi:hypothetical protein